MRFPARHVVVEHEPRGMDYMEVPFPVAETEAEQQPPPLPEEDEREMPLAVVSPEPTSEQLASMSGSQSSGVRSPSPPCCRLAFLSDAHGASDATLFP